jgi:hypothetical protein
MTAPLTDKSHLDEEVTVEATDVADRQKFEKLVARLSNQSVIKNYDAYADIPWDDPDYAIDLDDPRWQLADEDPLGATEWYRSLPLETRTRLGLYRYATAMKLGLQFENVLKRGLLEFTLDLPNGDPQFRYAYHELIEEAHHGLMFQEFVNRSGFDPPGLGWADKFGANRIVKLGRFFPELFFIFVLGGEDPIDHLQRETLRSDRPLHPLFEMIMRHHVTEEARHLSFARHYLKLNVPTLPASKRYVMSIAAPVILGVMAQLMMQAPRSLVREFEVPPDVVRQAYVDNDGHKQKTRDAVRKVRELCREIGLVNPVSRRVWSVLGIWDDDR